MSTRGPLELSIVVTIFDMAREAERTLFSLSRAHQRGVESINYEVIVVDNGSPEPFGEDAVRRHGDNFRYRYVADASPSPAAAMNSGAALATGRWLCVMIDGARMVTPGLVASAMGALAERSAALVETIAFHLGEEHRGRQAFDRAAEDTLLAGIGWPDDPYRLFDVSRLSASSRHGWYGPLYESNCIFVDRSRFHELGGFDERFDAPGGGYVNLDFYRRMVEGVGQPIVRLVGEASFHQLHGGASTGLSAAALRAKTWRWRLQYRKIRGNRYEPPAGSAFVLHGESESHAQRWLERSRDLWPI